MSIETSERVITYFKGNEDGPLLIIFGGMHGNEPAGVRALELMGKMLEVEPITNPEFNYKGSLLAMIGNLRAYRKNKRFINKDLNRMWKKEVVEDLYSKTLDECSEEQLEIKEILELIHEAIDDVKPKKIVVLDLHTTSSYGGIFSIATDDPESLRIAVELHAPVVKGMLKGIRGTTLHYFRSENFNDIPMAAVTFESGQHNEMLSINRAIAAITNCMRTIGSVSPEHVENQHDKLLIEHSRSLPKVSQLISKFDIQEGDEFKMLPDFKNFQRVKKGEPLALTKNGTVEAPEDALILMPLYQEQGEDGFFLIKRLEF